MLIVAGLCLVAAAFVVWPQLRKPADSGKVAGRDPSAGLNLKDPQPSYLLLQYVTDKGGNEVTRQMAIDWLSEQARLRQALKPEQEAWLFSMIEGGGHKDWGIGYKQWIFNEAFNVLHMAKDQKRLTHLLEGLALKHEDKTMRLYALQHIELQRGQGHLVGERAEQIYASLVRLAREDQSEVAGTALVNLIAWEGPEAEPSKDLIDLALDMAAETQRADDIRVTALHAVGAHSLALARTLAPDTIQPVQVRKAAIAWIGKYGSDGDAEALKQLAQENFRIAQAANPAFQAIEARQDGKPARERIEL